MGLTADKNMIDKDEYPQTAEIEKRCVNMIGHLWNVPGDGDVTGTSTTGSSEAAMLGGLAMKWRWRERMQAAGKPTDRPNLVTGSTSRSAGRSSAATGTWNRGSAPMEGDRYHLDAEQAVALCDENTIGVVTVLGSTFDGSYEPVGEICAALDELAYRGGPDVPVHVDAASGGFIAPFVQSHWCGTSASSGCIRSTPPATSTGSCTRASAGRCGAKRMPAEDLIFEVNYLGGSMPTFALNFSRPGSEVVAQYYMFVSLGFDGYKEIQCASSAIAQHVAKEIAEIGPY